MKKIIPLVFVMISLSCAGKERDTLRIAISEGIISLDPHTQDEVVTMEVLGNVYESLVSFDVDMQLIPMLCTGYTNLNDRTWRFYVRPGVKFHDGRLMSADDVIYSLERARSNEASVFKSMLDVVDRIKKIDSLTVEISTAKPRPNLINTLTLINIIPDGNDPKVKTIGTGPYGLEASSESMVLRLDGFKEYWGERPFFGKVEYLVMKDDSLREKSLLNGMIDIDANVLESYRTRMSENKKVKMITRPGSTITMLGLNVSGSLKNNPLSDIRLRQAISLAIDRRAMVELACHGHAVPANQVATQFIFGFNPDIREIDKEIQKARLLVNELKAKDTIKLTLKVSAAARLEGRMIADFLEPLGIDLTVDSMSWSELYNSIENGQAKFYLMGFGYSYGDASELLNDMVHSPGKYRDFGARNLSGYSNKKLDRIVEMADSEFDPAVRKKLLQEAIAITTNDLPFIPLYIRDSSYGMRRGLKWTQKTASVMLAKEIGPEIQ